MTTGPDPLDHLTPPGEGGRRLIGEDLADLAAALNPEDCTA